MITFNEFIAMKEGLWLNDRLAVVGLSKTPPPKPPKKTKPAPTPRIKPVHSSSPPKPVGEVQLPDAITMMDRMGINLVEPDRDQMRRLVDRAKKRAMIPTPQAPTPGATPTGRPGPAATAASPCSVPATNARGRAHPGHVR